MLHTGYLLKMGDGPINYDWNNRFIVLDMQNKSLSYFLSETDQSSRGLIDLSNAKIGNLMPIKGKRFGFTIKVNPNDK